MHRFSVSQWGKILIVRIRGIERNFLFRIVALVGLILFLLALGSAYYFYQKFITLQRNPEKMIQQGLADVKAQVGKLIVLPEDEDPTIATVSNLAELKGQPFFANATVGDKVLIYARAKKAILYSPLQHKIVEIAPLNTSQQK